ncbi:class I SAM-dependent methyltransferase [Agrobacterium rubi]|uniref:methyltransferase domain-containing protein n=1 Tax=Agrobacterium rubi TaxID=28099 RepID=UPI001573D189|nr:class I SAM-dependent methyltransferase [Agrobacterium rubi]NTF10127.1 class I SAM-dependent methyltransferase [Agrobacterium rubi]NTF21695.1 class I SAM-dependent methyltransferase [Agrobacterium rubi]NTF28552.1 class I SAM-dependent methyltransferase [Agrobacterium rubi]
MFKLVGAFILMGVWAKHRLMGYRKPNTVSADDRTARIAYVHDVIQSWLKFLPSDVSVRGRSVLELGPGSSLATGALLLAHGAKSYTALDAFRLAADETQDFRRDAIARYPGQLKTEDVDVAHRTLENASALQYRVDPGFDIPALCKDDKFDLILSCAAFEHFDAIETTIDGLTRVAQSGCVSLHIVDLQTHTNAIRQRDPNNIYRFSDRFYSHFAFPGQPNRKRPIDYVRAFERNGWVDVEVIAAKSIPKDLRKRLTSGVAKEFRGPEMDMHILDAVIISLYP